MHASCPRQRAKLLAPSAVCERLREQTEGGVEITPAQIPQPISFPLNP